MWPNRSDATDRWVSRIIWSNVDPACQLGFARRPPQLPNDDTFDDNRDDSGPLNYAPYGPKMPLSCLVTIPAWSWQSARMARMY